MSNPAYSLDPNGALGTYVTLPGHYRFGGRRGGASDNREDTNIELETDFGNDFVYNLQTRLVWELHWRLNETQLQTLADLNDAVGGSVNPFWFSLDGTGDDAYFVRKEAGFDPIELDTPDSSTGLMMYDYTMRLRQDFSQTITSTSVKITY